MRPTASHNTLYRYEVLRARYEIRDFYLNTVVRDVYENIGQSLSLAGMQIAALEQQTAIQTAVSSGELVGQTIKNLRQLCRRFYPDQDILDEVGFPKTLEQLIPLIFTEPPAFLQLEGEVKYPDPGIQLIAFGMLLEMLISIKNKKGRYLGMEISYHRKAISFIIHYQGEDILTESTSEEDDQYLSLNERAALIQSKFEQHSDPEGSKRILLIIPLKLTDYETNRKDRPGR